MYGRGYKMPIMVIPKRDSEGRIIDVVIETKSQIDLPL
jgi:hypothetical protein